jgi:hypothetical protein
VSAIPVRQRIARIFEEVQGCWAFRGVTSWDADKLFDWRDRNEPLTPQELVSLADIEKQVFGGP